MAKPNWYPRNQQSPANKILSSSSTQELCHFNSWLRAFCSLWSLLKTAAHRLPAKQGARVLFISRVKCLKQENMFLWLVINYTLTRERRKMLGKPLLQCAHGGPWTQNRGSVYKALDSIPRHQQILFIDKPLLTALVCCHQLGWVLGRQGRGEGECKKIWPPLFGSYIHISCF